MSTPIDSTPRLAGEDAERLRRDLTNVCDPDEARRRVEWARRQVLALMRPKQGNDLRRCAMTPTRYAVMAVSSPAELLALVRGGTLAPHELTFAAEYLGAIDDAATARDALLPLLDHPDRMVREGVLYGLAACALDDEAVKARAARIAREDESAAVREVAAELFQATICGGGT